MIRCASAPKYHGQGGLIEADPLQYSTRAALAAYMGSFKEAANRPGMPPGLAKWAERAPPVTPPQGDIQLIGTTAATAVDAVVNDGQGGPRLIMGDLWPNSVQFDMDKRRDDPKEMASILHLPALPLLRNLPLEH